MHCALVSQRTDLHSGCHGWFVVRELRWHDFFSAKTCSRCHGCNDRVSQVGYVRVDGAETDDVRDDALCSSAKFYTDGNEEGGVHVAL